MTNSGTGTAAATLPAPGQGNDAEIFNHDLLLNPGDAKKARELYPPAVVDFLDWQKLRDSFAVHERALLSEAFKMMETQVTEGFFSADIGIRGVNAAWLAGMREKIPGRDIWMSGQRLVDERSGIVDRLIRTPAR